MKLIFIKEAAEELNIHPHTLRKVMHALNQSFEIVSEKKTTHVFSEEHIKVIKYFCELKEEGYSYKGAIKKTINKFGVYE